MPSTIVCFKWTPRSHYRSQFGPESVNTLKRMLWRHYQHPHQLTCVTDDPQGIDEDVRIIPLWSDFADVPSPHGAHQPSCYRRLKLFSREAADIIGSRFVSLDLDTVIVGDVTPLWNRPEDFVCWGDTSRKSHYNGSMFMMTAGARSRVWETFDPVTSPMAAKGKGHFGSDQGHMSHVLGKGEATWTTADGVYSYQVHLKRDGGKLPANARITMWHGGLDPWMAQARALPWVREFYR